MKEKEIVTERDLKEAEKYTNSYMAVEDRLKNVEERISGIKENVEEPEEIRDNLETVTVCVHRACLNIPHFYILQLRNLSCTKI